MKIFLAIGFFGIICVFMFGYLGDPKIDFHTKSSVLSCTALALAVGFFLGQQSTINDYMDPKVKPRRPDAL